MSLVLAETTAPLTRRQIARLVKRGTSASVSAAWVAWSPSPGDSSPPSRTQDCGEHDARRRLRDAHAQLDLAELDTVDSTPEERKAAASCAVLAGIAAADAACCRALGRHSRSQDHRHVAVLVGDVSPGGADAAKQLERLLGLKDQVHGFEDIAGRSLLSAQRRQARALVSFAETVLER